jgi:hypothetical protein
MYLQISRLEEQVGHVALPPGTVLPHIVRDFDSVLPAAEEKDDT